MLVSILVIFTDASLEWETIEQYFLWQLISVHNIPVEHIMPILPKLEFVSEYIYWCFNFETILCWIDILPYFVSSRENFARLYGGDCFYRSCRSHNEHHGFIETRMVNFTITYSTKKYLLNKTI